MITQQLINPKSIVVIGGSNNINKPGGHIIKNLLEGNYAGKLYVVNPKEQEIQGLKVTNSILDLPQVEMGILAVAANNCKEAVNVLIRDKGVKAIIIISAGFSEGTTEGAALEAEIAEMCTENGVALFGPNCIGFANRYHHSVFTSPIPEFHHQGADIISSSGGVILFVFECAYLKGLRFNSIWSVGNAAVIGVEDVLQYMDENFDPEEDSKIKLLYIENIKDPDKFLSHASSLIRKGCKIAAIKSGSSTSGKRAALSHTGAIGASDSAVEALFRKAGIIRCYSREELATVACMLSLKELKGNRFAVVTHAGGPAVILTDALENGGLNVPVFKGDKADELKQKLLAGSSISNPIDILGTGTAKDLSIAIEYAEKYFPETDAIAVIFGSVGLGKISDALDVIREKSQSCTKPLFPILPSIVNSSEEVRQFIQKGGINFSDEVALASAVSRVISTPKPTSGQIELTDIDVPQIRRIIEGVCEEGYLKFPEIQTLFKATGLNVTNGVQPKGRALYVSAKYENRYGHVISCGLGGVFTEVFQDFSSGLAPLGYDEAHSMIRSLKAYKIFRKTDTANHINETLFANFIVRLSTLLRFATEIKELTIDPLIATKSEIIAVNGKIFVKK